MNDIKTEFLKLKFSLPGFITAAGVLACAGTIAGAAGKFHWLLDLCSHFPLQYAVSLLAFAMVLGFLRQRAFCGVFVFFALWNGIRLLPQVHSGQTPSASRVVPVHALLINVRTENRQFTKVKELVSAKHPEILVIEEINDRWMSDLQSLTNDYPHVMAEPRDDNFGVALFSRLPLRDAQVRYFGDAEVPSVVAHAFTAAGELLVVATHTIPPVGAERFLLRNEQLQRVAEFVRSTPGPTLLLGDLNVSPWSYYFKRFMRESGLVDTARGRGLQPTWPTTLPLLWVPIDHVLCSRSLAVLHRQTGPNIGSDHYPVAVTVGVR